MERQSAHPTRQLDLVDTTSKHSQTVLALILVTFASMQHDGQADSAVAHETNVLIREGENHQEHSRIHRKNVPQHQATSLDISSRTQPNRRLLAFIAIFFELTQVQGPRKTADTN